MKRDYYSSSIEDFVKAETDYVLGQLLIHDEFETTDLQKNAWRKEIQILKEQLISLPSGELAFEYTIPRIGHRIDVVLLINGIIFLLEFKVGDKEYRKTTEEQVMDYALDLKYFHEASNERYIIPVAVSTEAPEEEIMDIILSDDHISGVIHCNETNIDRMIKKLPVYCPIVNYIPPNSSWNKLRVFIAARFKFNSARKI